LLNCGAATTYLRTHIVSLYGADIANSNKVKGVTKQPLLSTFSNTFGMNMIHVQIKVELDQCWSFQSLAQATNSTMQSCQDTSELSQVTILG
jgi:hypothetical protein